MSNQFIEEQNQELLWNVFNRFPNMNSVHPDIAQNIFQETLGEIYDIIPKNVVQLSKYELQDLNKKTISIFWDKITKQTQQFTPSFTSQTNTNSYYETPLEKTNRDFENKQQQYEAMNAKPKLPDPTDMFQEPVGDGEDQAIQNMDELIARYQQQRDLDVPIVPTTDGSESETSPIHSSPIESVLGKIQIRLDRMEARLTQLENSSKIV
jgi:hypothetical protein